ncbi:MAG: Gfo/Idh/MocA family oxidoreductase [Alphaproteobacteria bacterium]|nr:Gfo/Idh/MocA family oxidoreductase [Alphaproteobacteria bacterium]
MFRWGVLSTAKIARLQLLPAMQDATNGVVSAIASRDLSRARELADRFGAPHAFGSYEALLQSDDVDGVYIPLPTSQHVEWSLKAANAGKHVLCEKPIALDAGHIEELVAARDSLGVVISEAFMVQYHPQWEKVRSLIDDGMIGQLRQVNGVFCYHNVDPENMRNQLSLGGGALPDIGVYPTVTTRIATGREPIQVRAQVDRDPQFGTDSYANVLADFGDFNLNFYVSTQMALQQQMVFHGSEGLIEVHAPFNAGDYDHASISLHNKSHDGAQIFRFPGVRQYRMLVEAFADKVQGADIDLFSLENSKANQAIIDAIYRAGEHDQWEKI